jgi:hypothetical protein
MSTISLRLSDSLHRGVRKLAREDSISINQFIATAVAEKMASLMTEDYLSARAVKGSRAKFERVLKKVKDVEPGPPDRMP